MKKVNCPYCGKLTDEATCPRCFAVIPLAEESVKEENPEPKKPRKNNKEVNDHG